MKIPKSINVFGNKVKVQIKDLSNYRTTNGYGIDGCYQPEDLLILLDKTLKGKQLEATFRHEVGHAIFHALGLKVTSITHDMEEIIVEGFAKFWSEF